MINDHEIRQTILSLIVLLSVLLQRHCLRPGPKVTEKVLPNGLKVLLKEDHKSPVVTFQIWYKVGSRNEKLGTTGMSHLLEHMMFKGTKKYGPKTFSQTVMRNGGNDNAFTGKDYTAYFENFAADRIDISLDLESDRMQNLLLDPKDVPVRAGRGEGRAPHADGGRSDHHAWSSR